MRRIALRLAPLIALAVVVVPARAAAPTSSVADAALQHSVVAEINAVRHAHGLRPIRAVAPLGRSAGGHSREMAAYGYFAHDSRDGTPFWKRIRKSYSARGFRVWSVGETLMWSSGDVDGAAVVRAWMHSPPHRRILLNRTWRDIGVSALTVSDPTGDYEGPGSVTLVTADFGIRR